MIERRNKKQMYDIERFVLDQIVRGSSTSSIIRDLKAQFGLNTDVHCRKIIGKVTKRLEQNNQQDIEQARAVYRQRYEDLYQKAVMEGRINDAKNILDSMAKIDGVIIQKIEQKTTQAYTIEL